MKILLMIIAVPVVAAIALAWLITIMRRAKVCWAAPNENLVRAEDITMAAPVAANSGVGPISGDPLLFGKLAGIAETSYTPPTGVATGNISVKFIGAFLLSVTAKSSLSPSVNAAIAVGDKIYADGGTLASDGSNCTYGFTLDNNSSTGVYFGNALDAITAGSTSTIRVRLKVSGNA